MWSYFMVFSNKKANYNTKAPLQRTDLRKGGQRGFTIVELLIAISVFSVVMIIAATAIIVIARQYQAGVTKTAMQSATRDIHQKISDNIKYSGGNIITVENYDVNVDGVNVKFNIICTDKTRYFYKTPSVDGSGNIATTVNFDNNMSGLYVEQASSGDYSSDANCKNGINPSTAQQLLPNSAKVAVFSVEPTATDASGQVTSTTVKTTFVRGEADMFDLSVAPGSLQCKSGVGNEWCSVVSLSSIINPRL